MKRPCKELKRIARENLSGQYRISMGAILTFRNHSFSGRTPFFYVTKRPAANRTDDYFFMLPIF